MPKFDKVILKEGKYRQWNEAKKAYEFVDVTPERIKKLVDTFQKMKSKGIRVPGPWKHDFNITAFTTGDNGLLASSTDNAGFWEDLASKVTEDGKLGLVGTIDAPGDAQDINTPAGKIGTLVRDTSIYTRKNVPITDGNDEVLEEAIMHIALVTHPIELNQQNFQLKDEQDACLVMSQMVEEPGEQGTSDTKSSPAILSQLINDLRDACKLYLPANTNIDNLVENLSIAVNQYKLLQSDPESDSETLETEPLVMSHLDQTQIDALINGKIVNPKTNKPYSKEDFSSSPLQENKGQPDQKMMLVMSAMQNSMQNDRRKAYRSRIDSLVESGRTTKSFADSNLYPMADNYNLEFKDDQVVTPPVETLLMSLESMPAPVSSQSHESNMLEMGQSWNADDDKDQEKIKNTAKYMATLV